MRERIFQVDNFFYLMENAGSFYYVYLLDHYDRREFCVLYTQNPREINIFQIKNELEAKILTLLNRKCYEANHLKTINTEQLAKAIYRLLSLEFFQ